MSAVITLTRPLEHVALLKLNRPQVCNAVDAQLTADLGRAAAELEADAEVRVVVLMGAGDKGFCSGADLKALAAGGVDQLSTPEGGFAGFAGLARRKVWFAAVHGHVLAGGLELMLACDFAIAAGNAAFGLPETRRGIIATEGGLYRLPRRVPQGLALRMIASGASISAELALQQGLVTELVPLDELESRALALAQTIAANAPLAVQHSVALARSALDRSEAELARASHELLAYIKQTRDFHEGASAFVERRAPVWSGA